MYDTIIHNTINNNYENMIDMCNELIKEINNEIEKEILEIKKKQKFTDHDWKVIVSHKYNNKYDYSQTKYIKCRINVDVICHIHGVFSLRGDNHMKGFGCTRCALELRLKNSPLTDTFYVNEKSKFWSPKNRLKPNEVSKKSNEFFIFDCNICGHDFSIRLFCVQMGQWCPYCVNKQLCENNCDICFSKSFASSPKAAQWSDKNNITPREVFKSSGKKYLFNCDKCCHEITMEIAHVSDGSWCIYCANHKLCNDINCKDCNEKSFVTYPMAKYWSVKNKLKAHMVFKGSKEKFIFDCPYCEKDYVGMLVWISNGRWCGCTTNRTETVLYNFLQKIYPHFIIEKEKKFDFCKNVFHLPFDFCIEQFKTIIELDGMQHFEINTHFKSTPEERQKTDKYKMIQAKNNGYSIIRILQRDVLQDRNNWEQKLKDAIIKTSQSIGNPMVIYIGKLYETHYFTLD